MEIQLKLRGNSEGFILESKLPDDEYWTERIEIVQEEEGYAVEFFRTPKFIHFLGEHHRVLKKD